ncbi:MAG: hypothetical protein QG613_782 [Pseudomonadota bacterium]|nr:hypothetical protein [Pseudomonadota bacterium]
MNAKKAAFCEGGLLVYSSLQSSFFISPPYKVFHNNQNWLRLKSSHFRTVEILLS